MCPAISPGAPFFGTTIKRLPRQWLPLFWFQHNQCRHFSGLFPAIPVSRLYRLLQFRDRVVRRNVAFPKAERDYSGIDRRPRNLQSVPEGVFQGGAFSRNSFFILVEQGKQGLESPRTSSPISLCASPPASGAPGESLGLDPVKLAIWTSVVPVRTV